MSDPKKPHNPELGRTLYEILTHDSNADLRKTKSWPDLDTYFPDVWEDDYIRADTNKLRIKGSDHHGLMINPPSVIKSASKEKVVRDEARPGPSTRLQPIPTPVRPKTAESLTSKSSKFPSKSSAAVEEFRKQKKAAAASTSVWEDKSGAVPGKTHPQSSDIPEIPGVIGKLYDPFINTLNDAWRLIQRSPGSVATVHNRLRQIFRGAEDVFSVTLYLLTKCDDSDQLQYNFSLNMQIMRVLKAWLTEGEVSHQQLNFLTSELKHLAFRVVTRQKLSELNAIVCEVYKFYEIREEFLIPIQDLCAWGMYRQACHFAYLLDFNKEFSIHAFVVPLILQGREQVTYPYLLENKKAQSELLAHLQTYMSMEHANKALKLYVRVEKIRLVKMEKLYPKFIAKLITQFKEKFNQPRPFAGHLKSATKKSVTWKVEPVTPAILHERLVERPRPASADSTLQEVQRALRYIKIQQSTTSASKIVAKDSTSKHEIVPVAKPKATTSKSAPSSPRESKSNDDQPVSVESYYEIRGDKGARYYVASNLPYFTYLQSPHGFRMFLQKIKDAQMLQRSVGGPGSDILVVAFDVKWIPPVENPLPSMLVVLVDQEVYLLDILCLQTYKKEREAVWKTMFQDFFNNRSILKLGFGAERIYRGLVATCSSWIEVKHNLVTCLDLSYTAKMIMDSKPSFFPYVDGVSVLGYGFSELVRICTGKPMNKTWHNSNWAERPLHDAQLVHLMSEVAAAMDIFGYMRKRSWFMQFDFEKLITGLVNIHPAGLPLSKHRATAAGQNQRLRKISLAGNPFRMIQYPADIKLICDKMFQDLAKELRLCGVDTLVLGDEDAHSECVRVASRDGRFIVTNPTYRKHMIEFVPPAFCYAIKDEKESASVQLERVFRHFNLRTTENDIFTRCLDCNGNTFIPIGNEVMGELMKSDDRPTAIYAGSDLIYISLRAFTDAERAAKNWNLISADGILKKPASSKTISGAPIHFDGITEAHLESPGLVFMVCDGCGRVYCEGGPFYSTPSILKHL